MQKAGGIIALIAGVFGTLAGVFTLVMGVFGPEKIDDRPSYIVHMGWAGIGFSFLVIVLGAVAMNTRSKVPGVLLILSSLVGAVFGGPLGTICMALALVGGILAIIGVSKAPATPAVTGK